MSGRRRRFGLQSLGLLLGALCRAARGTEADGAAFAADVERDRALATVVIEAPALGAAAEAPGGVAGYRLDGTDLGLLPGAGRPTLIEALAQLPGVSVDQNQQLHVRGSEGPQFQYHINGFLLPIDINTNPPFVSFLDPGFVERLELRLGVHPASVGLATGGVVALTPREGCDDPGMTVEATAGQRSTRPGRRRPGLPRRPRSDREPARRDLELGLFEPDARALRLP